MRNHGAHQLGLAASNLAAALLFVLIHVAQLSFTHPSHPRTKPHMVKHITPFRVEPVLQESKLLCLEAWENYLFAGGRSALPFGSQLRARSVGQAWSLPHYPAAPMNGVVFQPPCRPLPCRPVRWLAAAHHQPGGRWGAAALGGARQSAQLCRAARAAAGCGALKEHDALPD